MKISEAFYPLMSIIEIGLRNNINILLSKKFSSKYWYKTNDFNLIAIGFLSNTANDTIKSLLKSKKQPTSGRVISELNFGYSTSLFDKRYEKELWKNLRLAFPNCPKNIRKRKTISTKLNSIRKFRNRIFHHEPISWNIEALENYHKDLKDAINWLDIELLNWTKEISRVDETLNIEKQNI